jgi:hypothetical protein
MFRRYAFKVPVIFRRQLPIVAREQLIKSRLTGLNAPQCVFPSESASRHVTEPWWPDNDLAGCSACYCEGSADIFRSQKSEIGFPIPLNLVDGNAGQGKAAEARMCELALRPQTIECEVLL